MLGQWKGDEVGLNSIYNASPHYKPTYEDEERTELFYYNKLGYIETSVFFSLLLLSLGLISQWIC